MIPSRKLFQAELPRLFRLLCFALACFANVSGAAPPLGSAAPPNNSKWLAELLGNAGTQLTAYPGNLGWQTDHPASYPLPFVLVGTRPAGDVPVGGTSIRGKRRGEGDWVISDGSGAIWVTGLSAPEPGKPVVLIGQFTTDGALALRGIRFLVPASLKGKTIARTGDFIYFPLSANKGTAIPVEIDGGAVELAFSDERDALIVRAVKAGEARLRFFALGFMEEKPVLRGERTIVVK